MSQSDSFIDEVTEEVRRDRLYRNFRRYGWIGIMAVLLLVGGAAYNEWRKAQERAEAQALGDAIIAALGEEERAARNAALDAIQTETGGARAIVGLLAAGEGGAEMAPETVEQLLSLADSAEVPLVYRQIATLKAVALPGSGLSAEDKRSRLEGMAASSGIVRLLAEEQLALVDLETGDRDAALERLRGIYESAEATAGLRRRAEQLIVALDGDIEEEPGGTADGN